jgi:hypothetical protein
MDLNEKNITPESLKKMLTGTHETQNKIQIGYTGEATPTEIRNIGDKWTDSDGNEWEQRNGYAIKLGKEWQQELREYLNEFKNCPKETCTCTMPKRLDEKMKVIHGMCFDCVLSMEHKLRIEGKFEEYEKQKVKNNVMAWIKEAEKDKDLIIEELTRSLEFVNSNGLVEKWGNNVDPIQMKNKIEADFENLKQDLLKKLETTDG